MERVILCPLSSLQKDIYEYILELPDYLLLRGANAPCDCGVNQNYFHEYRNLVSEAERIEYQRKHEFKKRWECCYRVPKEGDKAVLYEFQHRNKTTECENCPFCILLPALTKLYQLSASVLLIQFNHADRSVEKDEKEKREAFAKLAFPEQVLKKLPGGTHCRCDAVMRTSDHFAMSGKMVKLDELLKKIKGEGGRVLLFSSSTQVLDIIQHYLSLESYIFRRIDGSTPSKDRQGLVNVFQKSDDIFCFLLSTRAAGWVFGVF